MAIVGKNRTRRLLSPPRAWLAATGALLALAGCLVGNFLTGAVVLSRHWDISLATFVARLTPDLLVRLMTAMFSPMDVLFYALAIWQGYKFSIVSATGE